ncbi:MAG: endonuclease/exonuclease/phosphatase family protein [Coriobacteriia bacterium]
MSCVVASLNIQHCQRSSPQRVAALLAERGVTVAALQEVDLGMARSGRTDQPAIIAAESGLAHYAFAPTLARDRGLYGLLLLSATPFVDYAEVPLPRLGAEEPRLAQLARVEIGGASVQLANTHLAVRGDSTTAQLRYLSAVVLSAHEHWLMVGDFNGELLPDGFGEGDLAPTFPSENPRKRIDHIAVSDGFPLGVRWETVCRPEITDHCLVLAHFGE